MISKTEEIRDEMEQLEFECANFVVEIVAVLKR